MVLHCCTCVACQHHAEKRATR
ncbi:hypothetical protein [Enterovibrio norvegicus]